MSRTRRRSAGRAVAAACEVVVTVAPATALVAVLDGVAPTSGLAVVYLLAVLTVAIRRGWAAARALAKLDGCDLERLPAIDGVERYYRLGAGAAGALTRLHTGLFDPDPSTIDAAALIAQRQPRQGAINALLLDLERQLTARKALEERLAQLPRTGYPFGRLRADLARAGAPRQLLGSRGALGRVYAEVMREVASAIRQAGHDLTRGGLSEEQALDRLAQDQHRWASLARDAARRAVSPPPRQDTSSAGPHRAGHPRADP
jgi:hypothetical protein